MQLNKKINKLSQNLRQSNTKLGDVFKTTQFDRIIKKCLLEAQQENLKLGNDPEAIIKSGFLVQLLQARSQIDFIETLESAADWREFCGFTNGIPVQSTFSRNWNNPNHNIVLDKAYTLLQRVIAKKKSFSKFLIPKEIEILLKLGYFCLPTDATFVELSAKRFAFALKGYKNSENKSVTGAKINFIIDAIHNMPVDYVPTEGNQHETKTIDTVLEGLHKNNHSWCRKAFNKELFPLLIIDKGYWNKKRFIEWTKTKTGFVCPVKKKNFVKNQLEFLDFPNSNPQTVDGLVYIDQSIDPLKLVISKNNNNRKNNWFLLTNIEKIDSKVVIQIYQRRWPIEEIFKWIKQHLNLNKPLVQSWEGFVNHCFYVFILLMLLQYFLIIFDLPRWQENLTILWRQLKHGPSNPWTFKNFRISLLFLEGGMD